MRTEEEIMEVLAEQDVIPLVLYLDVRGEAYQVDLNTVSSNTPRLNRVAEKLQGMGVLKIKIVNRPRRTIIYTITKKGKDLAGVFRQAQEVMRKD